MSVVIFDIEASCEDSEINSNYQMETIEIGAVKVSKGQIIDEFEIFVKPEYVDNLTDYCTDLTGITFADLKDADEFSEAILDFYSFIHGSEIYSCGNFDKNFLIRELEDKGDGYIHKLASNAISSSHTDLKRYYSQITGRKKQGMIGMADELGIELTGEHHRALSDSLNLTNIYLELERIREDKLAQVFSSKRMDKLIANINNNHEGEYVVSYDGLTYVSHSLLNDEAIELNFIEFMDMFSDIMITDNTERKLNYLNGKDLAALRNYTK